MLRTFLPLALVSALVGAQLQAQSAQKKSDARPAVTTPAATVINLNTASAADLQTLPGIGARVAARIIEYRQKRGPFKKIEELMNVQGIGEKSFLKLRPQITVGTKPESATSPQN